MTQQPDPPLSPADSMALIDAHQASRQRAQHLGGALLCGVWGVAYLVGWGAFYLSREHVLPVLVAGILTGVLTVAAIVFSAWFGARLGRGVRGPSQVTWAMYGCSWTIGFMALTAVNVGLQNAGLSDDQVTLLWSGSALLVIGLLYLAGGAMAHSWPQYVVGAWTMIAGAVSVYVGVPNNFLVLSLAGGGGFLAQAGYYTWRALRTSNPGPGSDRPVGIDAPAL
ncbi:MAG TPA: hypothetical protein VG247_13795 [Pseudonocardiaceae bacterium]|nr:hypothetical protein [Pseudonocardiaceae bacterium]